MHKQKQSKWTAAKPVIKPFNAKRPGKEELVSMYELGLARADAKKLEIKISFTIDRQTQYGRLLEVAAEHYTPGAMSLEHKCSLVARLIVQAWLCQAVDFPRLEFKPEILERPAPDAA